MQQFKSFTVSVATIYMVFLSAVQAQILTVKNSASTQNIQIVQIQKITPRLDSTYYDLVGGGRIATATLGQKWTFISSVGSKKLSLNEFKVQVLVQSGRISVHSEQKSQYSLYTLNGSLVKQSQTNQNQWETDISLSQVYVLQIISQKEVQKYLIKNKTYGE